MEVLESALGRVLSALEMDLIRSWYLNEELTCEDIELEIQEAILKPRFSIKYIDRILMTAKIEDRKLILKPRLF